MTKDTFQRAGDQTRVLVSANSQTNMTKSTVSVTVMYDEPPIALPATPVLRLPLTEVDTIDKVKILLANDETVTEALKTRYNLNISRDYKSSFVIRNYAPGIKQPSPLTTIPMAWSTFDGSLHDPEIIVVLDVSKSIPRSHEMYEIFQNHRPAIEEAELEAEQLRAGYSSALAENEHLKQRVARFQEDLNERQRVVDFQKKRILELLGKVDNLDEISYQAEFESDDD